MATLLELGAVNGDLTKDDIAFLKSKSRSLEECFSIFPIVHKLMNSRDRIIFAASQVVAESFAQGIHHLELRTTPKSVAGMTKRQYVAAVLRGIAHGKPEQMTVSLLLSVNRGESLASAFEVIDLLEEFGDETQGLDFSGNPTVSNFQYFSDVFIRARDMGRLTSIHCAETWDHYDTDWILDFSPDRIGHGCCLAEYQVKKLLDSKIPLEICATSNVKTGVVENYKGHIFKELHGEGHPIAICTDDSGIFSSTLTDEYLRLTTAFSLTTLQIRELAEESMRIARLHS